MNFLTMQDCDLTQKKLLIRADLNVALLNGQIMNDARLRAIVPTLLLALKANARILLISHLGRPKEGIIDKAYSLAPIAKHLSQLLNKKVRFEENWLETLSNKNNIECGEIVLGENVRFLKGEDSNDEALAKKMASLCDVFMMDAFATAHRKAASTVGVAKFAPEAIGGPLLTAEIQALEAILKNPKPPLVAIVGGAKVSSKLAILKSLLQKVNVLILGGGIANTFCKAKGFDIGDSLYEESLLEVAKEILATAKQIGVEVVLPEDVVVAREAKSGINSREIKLQKNDNNQIEGSRTSPADFIASDEKILDVGSATLKNYQKIIQNAGTILWNGPLGLFEIEEFSKGTEMLSHMIAKSSAFSVAGGGETVAAIEKYCVEKDISYISTGGGAFLEYLEGKTLPAIAILEERKAALLKQH